MAVEHLGGKADIKAVVIDNQAAYIDGSPIASSHTLKPAGWLALRRVRVQSAACKAGRVFPDRVPD